jgi:hypothetical protein
MYKKTYVIFVGENNKPDCEPFDQKTRSGKVIRQIIQHFENLPLIGFIRTNLIDADEFPKGRIDKLGISIKLFDRVIDGIKKEDANFFENKFELLFVLCGKKVQKHFHVVSEYIKVINVAHPSYAIRQAYTPVYIADTIQAIRDQWDV